jgi:acyl-CoA reductase-like NAD-dependent aldehyde dehydrogenase
MSFESRNPATGEVIAQYPENTAAEVETCLARAWAGWKSWSATPLATRTGFLNRLADALEARVDEFARLPLGPILGVMPWNLPFWQVLRFFIPAALVGNTVLVKHAENVKGCAIALEQLVKDAGGADGLYINLMVDRKAVPGIVADDRIRAVTVTASVAAGRSVAALAGEYGKKVSDLRDTVHRQVKDAVKLIWRGV